MKLTVEAKAQWVFAHWAGEWAQEREYYWSDGPCVFGQPLTTIVCMRTILTLLPFLESLIEDEPVPCSYLSFGSLLNEIAVIFGPVA